MPSNFKVVNAQLSYAKKSVFKLYPGRVDQETGLNKVIISIIGENRKQLFFLVTFSFKITHKNPTNVKHFSDAQYNKKIL